MYLYNTYTLFASGLKTVIAQLPHTSQHVCNAACRNITNQLVLSVGNPVSATNTTHPLCLPPTHIHTCMLTYTHTHTHTHTHAHTHTQSTPHKYTTQNACTYMCLCLCFMFFYSSSTLLYHRSSISMCCWRV